MATWYKMTVNLENSREATEVLWLKIDYSEGLSPVRFPPKNTSVLGMLKRKQSLPAQNLQNKELKTASAVSLGRFNKDIQLDCKLCLLQF